MGNNQSNERKKDWKLFKITKKNINDGYIRFYLDDCVTYRDGDWSRIDFDKVFFLTRLQLMDCDEGTYVIIDLEKTRRENHLHDFHVALDGVMKEIVGVWKDSEGNIRDSAGNTLETLANLSDIGDMLQERQRFNASIEQSRYANNHA